MTMVVPAAQLTPRLWRGGQTWEISRDPADADYPDGDYRLWVGTATIERSADYSYFADAERLHIHLGGGRLRLHFPDATIDLAARQTCTFSGERPLHAELSGATVRAFNLVYRQGMTSGAEFVRLTGTSDRQTVRIEADTARTQIVHVVSGRVVLDERVLEQGDTLLWEITGPCTQQLHVHSQTPDAELLLAFVSDPPAQPVTPA